MRTVVFLAALAAPLFCLRPVQAATLAKYYFEGNYNDSSGNGNTLTPSGPAGTISFANEDGAGVPGSQSLQFAPTANSYPQAVGGNYLGTNDPTLTVSFFFKATADGFFLNNFAGGLGGYPVGFGARLIYGGRFGLSTATGYGFNTIVTPAVANGGKDYRDGQWHEAIIKPFQFTFWVDNVQFSGTGGIAAGTPWLRVGAPVSSLNLGTSFTGLIDDIQVTGQGQGSISVPESDTAWLAVTALLLPLLRRLVS